MQNNFQSSLLEITYILYSIELNSDYTKYDKYNIGVLPGSSGSVVGWGTMLQAGRSLVRFPVR
jgi:hypothetical protein